MHSAVVPAKAGTQQPLSNNKKPRPGVLDRPLARAMTAEYAAYFPHTSSATSTIIFSFAHCSSSARILPSSVEAKPHCGDRQS